MYKKYIKRLLDIIFAIVTFTLFSWLYIIIAILIRIKLGSPVIFKQDRPGKDEKIFQLYKFRSMSDLRDKNGKLLPDKYRLTKFGRFLRSTSLDELPELINILKGDMSVVGPRPWAISYIKYYTANEHRRHTVRPGLTGLAQVNGRTAANWDDRLKYDIEYVDNVSLKMDIMIILKTIIKTILRADVIDAEIQGDFSDYRKKQWADGKVLKPEGID